MAELQRIRWYNPELESFEWREVPQSDEEALWLLSSSSYRPTSIDTYRLLAEVGGKHHSGA